MVPILHSFHTRSVRQMSRLELQLILLERLSGLCSSGNIDVTDEMLEQIRKVRMNHGKDAQEQG